MPVRDHENYSFPQLQVEDNLPCHAALAAVTLLSPLLWALPEKRSVPWSRLGCVAALCWVDTLGFAATRRGHADGARWGLLVQLHLSSQVLDKSKTRNNSDCFRRWELLAVIILVAHSQ